MRKNYENKAHVAVAAKAIEADIKRYRLAIRGR